MAITADNLFHHMYVVKKGSLCSRYGHKKSYFTRSGWTHLCSDMAGAYTLMYLSYAFVAEILFFPTKC